MSRERFEGVTIGAVPCPKVIVTVLRASRSSQAGAGDESRPPRPSGGTERMVSAVRSLKPGCEAGLNVP